MKNIKNFNGNYEFLEYMGDSLNLDVCKAIEGKAFLIKDRCYFKYLHREDRIEYNKNIIMSTDFDFKTFLFPTEIFLVGNYIAGYKTEFFPNDIFNKMDVKEGITFDLRKLYKARKKMISDIKKLSFNNYKITNIKDNLMFDGEKLVAINTLGYHKIDNVRYVENLVALDSAINYRLSKIEPMVKPFIDMPTDEVMKKIVKNNHSYYLKVK